MRSDRRTSELSSGGPRLLVSVRDLAEAREALAGGCDILDLKEPGHGSLGMVEVAEIERVVRSLRERILLAERADHSQDASPVVVSAALGEAAEWRDRDVPALPAGLTFAKLGLAGLGRDPAGLDVWRAVRERFDARAETPIGWISVVYADWQAAHAPPPEAIVAEAGDCAGVLFDTFHKDGRALFDWLSEAELRLLLESMRAPGVPVALAGSLRREHLAAVARLAPEIVAIRSAACVGGDRRGRICRDAVRAFRQHLQEAAIEPASGGRQPPSPCASADVGPGG